MFDKFESTLRYLFSCLLLLESESGFHRSVGPDIVTEQLWVVQIMIYTTVCKIVSTDEVGVGKISVFKKKKKKKKPGSSPVPDWYLSSIKVKFPSATSMLCSAHHPIDQTHKITAKKEKETQSNCGRFSVRAPLLSPLAGRGAGGRGHAGACCLKRFGGTHREAHYRDRSSGDVRGVSHFDRPKQIKKRARG